MMIFTDHSQVALMIDSTQWPHRALFIIVRPMRR